MTEQATLSSIPDRFIFLAEDDLDDQELFIDAINQQQPIAIETSNNGRKAIVYLDSLPDTQLPSLIVLDYNLPEVDGAQILKQLSERSRYAPIPKVVWSTSNSPLYQDICLKLGAQAYFVKPSDVMGIETVAKEMLAFL